LLHTSRTIRQLNIPRPTISGFLQRYKERDSIDDKPRSGRPRKTTDSDDRYIIRTALKETRIPLAELKQDVNLPICERTLQRQLKEAGIQKWRALTRPLLTNKHAKNCLNWAKRHRHWTIEDWKRVIWLDECAVQKDSDPRQVWVFRCQNNEEKYTQKTLCPNQKVVQCRR